MGMDDMMAMDELMAVYGICSVCRFWVLGILLFADTAYVTFFQFETFFYSFFVPIYTDFAPIYTDFARLSLE